MQKRRIIKSEIIVDAILNIIELLPPMLYPVEMPRKNLIRTNLYPYHIVARSNNKEWFYLPLPMVWEIFQTLILKATIKFKLECPNYVLMNNHFHMLVWTPLANIDVIMQFLLKNIADKINLNANKINHVFGGPYKWTLIENEKYYWNVIRYICQNPLRANLVEECFKYPYLHLDFDALPISSHHDLQDIRKWIESTPNLEEVSSLKNALSRTRFKISANRKTGKSPIYDSPFLH